MDGRRESPLKRVRAEAEPAALMSRPSKAKRSGPRAFAYRIPAELNEEIKAAVDEYEREGWITNCSLVAAAWLEAGLACWKRGEVEVEGREAAAPGRRGREL